jgi:hypothetical protein
LGNQIKARTLWVVFRICTATSGYANTNLPSVALAIGGFATITALGGSAHIEHLRLKHKQGAYTFAHCTLAGLCGTSIASHCPWQTWCKL